MNERVAVSQVNSSQLANLVRSHVVKVTKPQSDQAITLDLNDGAGAKLDLSAVANEKMTLVHVDTKLVILFDNQSTVTAEPFFDLSGKPLANLNVELSAGRTLNGEQFAQSVSITDDQSVLPAGDPSSGADFRDVFIDSLPGSMSPLALMAQEMPGIFGRGSTVTDADFGVVAHAQLFNTPASTIVGSAPGITNIPAPGGAGTQVFEAGLLGSRGQGEFDGTQAGNPGFQTTTRAGTIGFTSPDGLLSVSLGGNVVTATTQADAQLHPFADGTTGSLAAWVTFNAETGNGAIHYIYSLLDNTVGVPNASFAVVVTDPDGDHNDAANLVINIVDDAPRAIGDTDSVTPGQTTPETGNVILGAGASGADVPGADGGLTVVSATGTGGPVAVNAAGVPVTGAFGTLTLFSGGQYSYDHTGAPGGGIDTFSYTVQDADGSQSTATLQIAVGDSAPGSIIIPTDTTVTAVFEAGLPARTIGGVTESAGSDAGNHDGNAPTVTQLGKITFTSVDGVGFVTIGGQAIHVGETKTIHDGTTGDLNVTSVSYDTTNGKGEIDYTYTLLDNTSGSNANGGDTTSTFTVAVTDADGSTAQAGSNLVITVKDDKPVANPDTDRVVAGQLAAEHGDVRDGSGTTSNGADVLGADGPAQGGAVVGVSFNGTPGSVGTAIQGKYGALTLFADGHYDYQRNFGLAGGPGHIDTFNYRIQDGDGSQANATLTITVDDSAPGGFQIPTEGQADAVVFEAALPARGNEPAGSNPSPQFASATGTIDFASADGVASVTVGGQMFHLGETGTILDGTTGRLDITSVTYDAKTGLGEIDYKYTLLDNTSGDKTKLNGDTGTSFTVAVTDLDNTTTQGGVLTIDIVDDQPQARSDVVSLTGGQTNAATGNVLTGDATADGVVADVQGADGATVISIAFGNLVKTVDPSGSITTITTDHGTLTIDASGNFSYTRTSGGTDTFTYTIKDGDGDISSAQLTVQISDSVPSNIVIPGVGGADTTVNEAALPARVVNGVTESAGSHAGDTADFPLTTQTGTIMFSSPDGVSKIELGGLSIDATTTAPNTQVTFTDSTGSLTAFYTIDQPGAYKIHYTYTLLDNTDAQTTPSVSFPVVITDLDQDRTQGGDLVITVNDDKPIANVDAAELTATDSQASGSVVANDVLGADGQKPGGAVVGIAKGGDPGTPIIGGLNTQIRGDHGTLTIDANGAYTYTRFSSGIDTFTYTMQDGDGSQSNATLTITVDNALPGVLNIPQVNNANAGTLVDEAGLATGSNPTATSETTTGAITFTSLDGVGSITVVDNTSPTNTIVLDSNNPSRILTNATGSLQASYTIDAQGRGTITYTYTLLHNTDAAGTSSVKFDVTLKDSNNDEVGGTLTVGIKDDTPIAKADTDHLTATDLSTDGNVVDGTNTTTLPPGVDVLGADGPKLGGAVVGIASNNNGTTGTVGVGLLGAHGTLTIDAQGHYTYTRFGAGTDTFTYRVQDGDGSQSSATLTFTIDNALPGVLNIPQVGVANVGTLVDEAGLATGSNPAATTETTTGKITFTSLDGVGSITIADPNNSNNKIILSSGHTSDTLNAGPGTLQASYTFDGSDNGTITYTYALLQATAGNPAVNGGDTATNFTVTLLDSNNDQSAGTLAIDIKDDKPIANPDTDLVVSGQLTVEHGDVVDGSGTTSGVVDVLGADGSAASNSPVVGVSAGLVGTPVTGVGAPIPGLFGTLTLFADGHYNYQRDFGVEGGDNHVDPFTYTIRDGDGSQAIATLNITVANSAPVFDFNTFPQPGDADAVVFEAGLPARTIGNIHEPAGSNSLAQITAVGTIEFASADGVGSVSLGGNPVSKDPGTVFSDSTGLLQAFYFYDSNTGQGHITYIYTLHDNTIGDPTKRGGDTSVSFTVAVTDLDNQQIVAARDLVIDIVDDKPVARPDTDAVASNKTTAETGNVLDGSGTGGGINGTGVDVRGADDATVVSVGLHGTSTVVAVDPATGGSITTTHGTLTIDAHGNYSYVRTSGGTDVFDYTLRDSDGSQSSSTLTIVVGGSAPGNFNFPPGGDPNSGTEVFEAGLAARTIVPEILESAGSHVGEAGFPTRTSGVITFTSPDGVSKIELGGLAIDATTTPQNTQVPFVDPAGLYSLTASYKLTGNVYSINYTYTLLDNTLVDPSTLNYVVAVTDADGDRTVGGNLSITVVDDSPTAKSDHDRVAPGQVADETGFVLSGQGTVEGQTNADVQGADGVVVVSVALGINVRAVGATAPALISGTFGDLTLHSDGFYSYTRKIDVPGSDSNTDAFIYTVKDGDGDLSSATLTIAVADSAPGAFVFPIANTIGVTKVFEAGLGARGPGESPGSHAGDALFPVSASGTITFTSLDGVGSVTLGALSLGTVEPPVPFPDGSTAQMDAWYTYEATTGHGVIHYTYRLIDNRSPTDITADYAVVVTDRDGDPTAAGTLTIVIPNDTPTANPDTDLVAAGKFTAETGNVVSGLGTTSGTADVLGADGAAVGGPVVGLSKGSNANLVDPTTLGGSGVRGDFGTLTMLKDASGNYSGDYSYVRNADTPGGVDDVFTYTVKDGDGDLSHATLTVVIADSTPGNIVIPVATVFEAGLPARGVEPAGSDPTKAISTSGTISFTSIDGLESVSLGGHVLDLNDPATPFTDGTTGSYTAHYSYNAQTRNGTVTYNYTLLDNTIGDQSVTNGNTVRNLALVITDRDHDPSAPTNLTINVVDDIPGAKPDTDIVGSSSLVEAGNVFTGRETTSNVVDIMGADGPATGGPVVAVGLGTGIPVNGLGVQINGAFGKLTMLKDASGNYSGDYSYVRDIGGPNFGTNDDTFTYKIRDGDGSESTATLTIHVADGAPLILPIPVINGPSTTVFEAGLGPRGPGESPGSDAGNPDGRSPTVTSGRIDFISLDGVASVSMMPGHFLGRDVESTFPDGQGTGTMSAFYTYNASTGQGSIFYRYTLLDNAGFGQTQVVFPVVVTDLDGDSGLPGKSLAIAIVDDQPVATPDALTVPAVAGIFTGNVITGVGTDGSPDILGADGAHVSGLVGAIFPGIFIDQPSSLNRPVSGHNGGLLTLSGNGDFTFDSGSLAQGAFTTYQYTLKDSDADPNFQTGIGYSDGVLFFSRDSIDGIVTSGSLVSANGSDTFAVSAPALLNAGDFIHGTGDAATTDTLRLDAADNYNLTTSSVSNIDSVMLGKNAAGSNIVVGDSVVSTADFNKDGVGGDLQISEKSPLSDGVIINASSLTGSNHIVVDGLNLDGNDILKGGAGNDILAGDKGSDTLTGGAGANHFQYNSPLDGGTFTNQAGADHIVDFNAAKGDVIDILGAAFGNLAPNTNVAAIFGSSANDTFASPAELLHFNTSTHTLLYDSNGSGTGGVQAALAVFDNHAIVAATNIHVV